MNQYAFVIYSSTKTLSNYYAYEYGFATHYFRILGDKPFARGDVVEILSYGRESRNEFRINVKVLGNPNVNSREIDYKDRVEIPTLLFLSSRISLSPFSEYDITSITNAEILNFEGAVQGSNKIYAIACLVHGDEAKIEAQDPHSKVRWMWVVSDRDVPKRRAA